ncbi:serine hydrolase [Streptomyces sp. NPDC048696]|uniref:serine hydrolase n=1 Tax=Streptomyces sp. NPDC048696 TaxID=3365585 RepID=UPI003718500F
MFRRSGTARRIRGGALGAAVAASVVAQLAAGAAPAAAASSVTCTSGDSAFAAKLSKDITSALRGRDSLTAVALYDRSTGTRCELRATDTFDSASVVKATVLATLLWDATRQDRSLTQRERGLATKMITESDNASTTELWKQLGAAKVQSFLSAAGMTQTTPGADGYWGLTRITARDQARLLALLTSRNALLSDAARAYQLGLMNRVVAGQRWGTPAGAPGGAIVQLKNGWLQRSTHGWRVHSIGAFTGNGHDYAMAVLTEDNATMNQGVDTIEAVARAVHGDLGTPGVVARPWHPPKWQRPSPVRVLPQEAVPPVPEAPAGRTLITAVPGR